MAEKPTDFLLHHTSGRIFKILQTSGPIEHFKTNARKSNSGILKILDLLGNIPRLFCFQYTRKIHINN